MTSPRFVNHRNRQRLPVNFEDGIYAKGIDILSAVEQITGNQSMSTATALTTTTDRYTALSGGVGYSQNDVVVRTGIYDLSGDQVVFTVIWTNYATGTILTTPPSLSTLSLQGQAGITNTELRAAPIGTITAAQSPEVLGIGSTGDSAAPEDGSGSYSMISALKRMVSTLYSLRARLPAALGSQTRTASLGVALSIEQEAIISDAARAISLSNEKMDLLLNRLPSSVGSKASTDSMSVVISNPHENWWEYGMVQNSQGQVVSETEQSNLGRIRTRNWTYVTDVDGNTTSASSAWVYQS